MTTTLPPDSDETRPGRSRRRDPVIVLALAVLAMGAVLAAVLLAPRPAPGGSAPATTPPPASVAGPTTPPAASGTLAPTSGPGTAPATPGPSSAAPPVPADAVTAVWPTSAVPTRYSDPVAAARGFAIDLAAFAAPVVGDYRAGDSRSGEVEVRPAPDGPVTTVFVRLLGDGTWWVLGSATADVTLESPSAGDLVAGTAELRGTALAFEGTVDVRIMDDTLATLATGIVTGGGDVARPFTGSFPFDGPASPYGTILLTTASGADGSTWTASVVRVALAP